MPKLIIAILLILISDLVVAQNIFSALHMNEERDYKTKRPKKIVETSTYYHSNGKEIVKNVKEFDAAGMLLKEERFNEGGSLTVRLTYSNDTVNRLTLTRMFERWNQFGNTKETAYYIYDSNKFLIRITDINANDKVIRRSEIRCNEKGDPIELRLFDPNGKPFGMETASYLYDKNKTVTTVISNEGSILSTDTIKISFREAYLYPSGVERYNLNGDLIIWTSQNFSKTETTLFESEYSYDNFGNCTQEITYKVKVKANGKRKREISKDLKKEYVYF